MGDGMGWQKQRLQAHGQSMGRGDRLGSTCVQPKRGRRRRSVWVVVVVVVVVLLLCEGPGPTGLRRRIED